MGNGSPSKEQDLPLYEAMYLSSPFTLGTCSLDVRNLGHSCSLLLPSTPFPSLPGSGISKGKGRGEGRVVGRAQSGMVDLGTMNVHHFSRHL